MKEFNFKKEVSVLKILMIKGLIFVELGFSIWILEDVNCNVVFLIFVVRGRKEIGRNKGISIENEGSSWWCKK